MPSSWERIAESLLMRILRKGLDKILKSDNKKTPEPPPPESTQPKSHPWRLCPLGEHWVRTHDLTVPASSRGPERETIRHGHCRKNRTNQECYTADEFHEIARTCFETLRNDSEAMPTPYDFGSPIGNKYDLSIAGWTKFWNETLQPENPLTPDFLKALIYSESSFRDLPDGSSKGGQVRGLLQITEQTRLILRDPKGELKDHLIEITPEESRDPEINIAAGTRWLLYKRHRLENRLKREVTWEEAGAEYKGIFNDLGKNKKSDEIYEKLKKRHKQLQDRRRKNDLP